MIRHKIYLNGDCPKTLNGELKIVYKDSRVEVINETAGSPSEAEGLCALRCLCVGVAECSFILSDGRLVAKACVVNMKRIPFDLKMAKDGAKIVTRDGAAVEMSIFHDGYFLGTFETKEHGKLACAWYNNGKTYNTTPNRPYYLDLELLVEEEPNQLSEKNNMVIRKGQYYICIKDFVMDDGTIGFSQGKGYYSDKEYCLVDNNGFSNFWQCPEMTEYFRPAIPDKMPKAIS